MKVKALLCAALLLAGCDKAPAPAQSFAGLGNDAADFAQVVPGKVFSFPDDHGPHDGFRIEWWYVTANLKDAQGNVFGVQWTLFRNALKPGPTQAGWHDSTVWLGHAAVTSATRHYAAERLARGGVGQAGAQAVPFNAWIDDWNFASRPGAASALADMQLKAGGAQFAYDLHLTSSRPLVLQGANGYSRKSDLGQASYYYSQPFFNASGSLSIDGKVYQVTGPAWLDREWSSQPLSASQTGWDWFSLHLDSGAQLMLFRVRQQDGAGYLTGTWIDPQGHAETLHNANIQLAPLATTAIEGRNMPTRWSLKIPGKQLDISPEAVNPNAWMNLSIPYWEGPVRFDGGVGYLEMTGY
ncbi:MULTISPECIES: lipocalin-like domain-containing protein [Pseudomonas]|jgi:predicted secreted hydrolase|uniref:Iron ABC transporter permease n=2 Tax=Pseudomonas TaxID=286 RepID=A0A4Y9TPQ6_PSEFL|nr:MULTISPECIES: lipocalin-like domain-containing protein [Pseudomonas]CRM96177.1 putative secreted hydrolase [Pseudomonas sp. 22 E 5]QXH65659.1 iron ABC transporter permease [Pseudomonas asgharzadehiana]TFW44962.1 iron ABC transporter permease [Pseudomonas fluorescens]TKJ65605.1 iron ABC transporter permease [Pseudomonas sp. CFBP13506]CRM14301.1 putative secreted hydrolase [Pseudomonas sp. 31 E 6]